MTSSLLPSRPLKVFMIAGEPSGDALGAETMKALNYVYPCTFLGVGGPLMAKEGLNESLLPMEDLSVMGFSEVLPRLFKILKYIKFIKNTLQTKKPDILITIDSSGFNTPIAKFAKTIGMKCIHLVAPTVWAWKPKRAKKIASIYDHLICLFPFEPPYFEAHGLKTTYVGHPVYYKKKVNTPNNHTLLLLPGSRNMEIDRHFRLFCEVANQDLTCHHVMILTLPHLLNKVTNIAKETLQKPYTITCDKEDAFCKASYALAASGTVSLELAHQGIPAVIAYKVNTLTGFLAKYLIHTPWVGLINILAKKTIMPEYLQNQCTKENLTQGLVWIQNHGQDLKQAYLETLKTLSFKPSSIARVVLDVCHKKALRTYGRKKGKANTKDMCTTYPDCFLDGENLPQSPSVFLEIGSGSGEHIVELAKQSPHSLYIGADIFEPGLQKTCQNIKKMGITNVKLYPKDVRFFLPLIPPHSLEGVFILFPDPWHKTSHKERRIITENMLRTLHALLKPKGFIRIATDQPDYQKAIHAILPKVHDIFHQIRPDVTKRPDLATWPATHYEAKKAKFSDQSYFYELRKN